MKTNRLLFLTGLLFTLTFGFTVEQVLNRSYDSTNSALRINVVAGGSSATIAGSGTANRVAKFTDATTIGDSLLSDDGTSVTLTSGQFLAPNGLAGTPSYSFTNDPDTGMFMDSVGRLDLSTAGVSRLFVSASGTFVVGDLRLSGNGDVILAKDDANILASRNGTAAQTFRLYETYTNSTNYGRGSLAMGSNTLTIAAETAGTGSDDMGITLTPAGAGNVTVATNFTFDGNDFRLRGQNLTTAADNTTNMLQISGTMPSVPTTAVAGVNFAPSGAGSAAQVNYAFRNYYQSGYTGSSSTVSVGINNDNAGTGATLNLVSTLATPPVGNFGILSIAGPIANTSNTYGVFGDASSNGTSAGVWGRNANTAATGTNIGVLGSAAASTSVSALKGAAGLFTLNTALPTDSVTVALIAQNSTTEDIFRGYDATTLMFRMEDTGEFTSAGTSSIGWEMVIAANQACNTTCTPACVFGFAENAVTGDLIVGCGDATADRCVCAGP